MGDVNDVIKGAKRYQGGRVLGARAPWTVEIFEALIPILSYFSIICMDMMLTIWLILFYGSFRPGEVVADKRTNFHKVKTLYGRDIKFESWPEYEFFKIRLSQYKTKQTAVLSKGGKDIGTWCTVSLASSHKFSVFVKRYLRRRCGNNKNPTGQKPNKPLFTWPNGMIYIKDDLTKHLRKSLLLLKTHCKKYAKLCIADFNGHSFRIGAATLMAAAGVERWVIMILGRWKSLDSILLYPQMDGHQISAFMIKAERENTKGT